MNSRIVLPVFRVVLVLVLLPFAVGAPRAAAESVDLSKAVLVSAGESEVRGKVVEMMREEIQKRTGVSLAQAASVSGDTAAIVLALANDKTAASAGLQPPAKPEAYAVSVTRDAGGSSQVYVLGQDERGLLFGAGRLLRMLRMKQGALTLDEAVSVASAPANPIRGHQIGYRNTANSYDKWELSDYEQYIRDMAVFGANSVELIPSLNPEEREGPHMSVTIWDMTVAVSELLDAYGMDVWLWIGLDGDVRDEKVAEEELASRRALFAACKRIDGVFVPGGDPGHTAPEDLMPWLERMAEVLHESHPEAGLWVSNQGFTHEQNDVFFAYLQEKQPKWLEGVIFGPWAKISMEEERARTPEQYPIRRYPDICHCLRAQYTVPDWDRAFANTLGREPFNPRPRAIKTIQNLYAPLAVGAITYSDGVTDDVNKMVWASLDWDPNASVETILGDYARYFFGADHEKDVAEGILAFEDNWRGPLAECTGIEKNLARWEGVEKASPAEMAPNWRLQMCVFRAIYDAYLQRRLAYETDLEQQAMAALREAPNIGSTKAITRARVILNKAGEQPTPVTELRQRLVELGESLWQSIGMQLDVAKYQARNAERGAVLEFLDTPLNDRAYLMETLGEMRKLPVDIQRQERIKELLDWETPGPGSFYDDLGNPTKQPHLVKQKTWAEDPGGIATAQQEYSKGEGLRLSWMDQAQTLFGTPLLMSYTDLDPKAKYTLRVTYAGRYHATMSLVANGRTEIHGPLPQPKPCAPVSFALDPALTAGGKLDLEWQLVEGRGCQVAEVWLIRN